MLNIIFWLPEMVPLAIYFITLQYHFAKAAYERIEGARKVLYGWNNLSSLT